MRQTDGYEDRSGGLPLIYMALAVSFFVLMILLLVLFMNRDQSKPAYIAEGAGGGTEQVASGQGGAYLSQGSDLTVGGEAYAPEDSTADSAGSGGMVAGDLDFWDMYPMGGEGLEEESGEERDEDSKEQENVLPDPSADGNHVEIVYADGTSEWVPINPYWKKNTYDFTNLVSKNKLLEYYSDGKQVSFLGVDLSRYQKDVDFRALKRAGIDFCMLRVGSRGYETGALQADEYFDQYLAGAKEAGLDIGVYFYSQAVTEAEAIEEASMVLQKIAGQPVKYPVAFDMEFVNNDDARVETLTRDERTAISLAFLRTIEDAGYTGMLYGNKEWLLKRIDLSKFENYDIWLSQEDDVPDYPYEYSMWQYSRQGEVSGVDGYVDLNISFVDYSAR
ncbi:MAG: glycoside hydrolase family 25 protein [Lachnospiraceae bacterium]|nr:glycoside hydrolase family 25 protein [Lachnospiraceae bacterium]